jgi:hypothetical protein
MLNYLHVYGAFLGSRKVLGFCSIPLQRGLIKKKILILSNKMM